MKRRSEQGVALVVTLILLSVITFMAVAFLAISRHEREGVINRSHQNDSVFAANAAIEHVKAKMISEMVLQTNGFNFGMLVSTNWINTNGFFQNGSPNLAPFSSLTNVNYDFVAVSHATLGLNDQLQNIANLQILPRPPVFYSTNNTRLLQTFTDFRFYLDYNRNGKFDTNGWIEPYYGTNPPPVGSRPLMFAKGDPEWIGILDRPELPHSRSNQFIARYAFIALPIGQTMDINYIHNVANYPANAGVLTGPADYQGFLRDQGVGTWEINVGAFLYAMNPIIWGNGGLQYTYDPVQKAQTVGLGFQDAAKILEYRYGNNYNSMLSFAQMYPGVGPGSPSSQFALDSMDGYSLGLLATNTANVTITDPDSTYTTRRWSGSENTNWFFTPQDFFKVGVGNANSFSNRLYSMGLPGNTSDTTNQYAFYKMLEQLGVDSFPESGKINLNYANVNGQYATNFQNWFPEQFFTNAANAMLATLTKEPGYTNLSTGYIPIYPTNAYTPAVHRLLQLAANMYDATTSRQFPSGVGYPNYFPSVFKPILGVTNGTEIYIKGYKEVTDQPADYISKPFDLSDKSTTNLNNLITQIGSNPDRVNVYGIPYVIGAKKQLPNFNEFSMATMFQLTRRMDIKKDSQSQPLSAWHYNTQYQIGISNLFALELWNSYTNMYTRPIQILVTNELSIALTNRLGVIQRLDRIPIGTNLVLAQMTNSAVDFVRNMKASFVLPLTTNVPFVTNSFLHYSPQYLDPSPNPGFELNPGTNATVWGYSITNRLRVMMIDVATRRLIDYVQLDGLDATGDLMKDLQATNAPGQNLNLFEDVWNTNGPTTVSPQLLKGMHDQIQISLGNGGTMNSEWTGYMLNPPAGNSRTLAIKGFSDFWNGAVTNLEMQVPFTPTAKRHLYRTWQANDPLVHYFSADLADVDQNKTATQKDDLGKTITLSYLMPDLGVLNKRFRPWGGRPGTGPDGDATAYDLSFKDSLVRRPDDWQFPTNKFPSVGWLGRVHRGTPWQTMYLKSTGVATNLFGKWEQWTGNNYLNTNVVVQGIADAPLTHPTNDWKLVGLFTAAANDNATRGQLSINQTNAPAWYAVLSGAIAMTNSAPDDGPFPKYDPFVIDPIVHNLAISNILTGIERTRSNNYLGQVFTNLGDILAVPELTVSSPFLNHSTDSQLQNGISDDVYERIPQQMLGLLKVGEPRYVVYAYGQSLKPADRSLYQGSGPYFGLCTNYTVTGEALIRAVIHVENPPIPGQLQLSQPRVIVDQYNVIPPE